MTISSKRLNGAFTERSEHGHFIVNHSINPRHDQGGVQCDGEVSSKSMATRKKYKIVLSEKYVRKSKNGKEWFQFPVNISSQLVAIQTIIPLDPYTEPDMEQVRKEAYQKGYETGYKDGYNEPGKNQQEAYQRGINDAREGKASCQFCRFTDVRQDMEPCASCSNNYDNKFEPEEQITKGDIVLIKSTPEVEILVTYADEEYVSGIALTEVDGNCEIGDQYTNIRISNVEKTGKHYDIVSVLRKMRENNG